MMIHLPPKRPLSGLTEKNSKGNPSKCLLPPEELSSRRGVALQEEEEVAEEVLEAVVVDVGLEVAAEAVVVVVDPTLTLREGTGHVLTVLVAT